MKEHELLKQFEKTLNDEEFDCSLVDPSEEVPYERLLIFLGMDEKERERILEVTALKQELVQGMDLIESDEPDFFRVQLQIGFPFKIKPNCCAQVGSLVCYLNRLIELPGFEMNEIDLQVSYRYVLMYGEGKFNKKLFISLVGIIMLFIELFENTIERVSSGEITFNEILEQIVQIAQAISPKENLVKKSSQRHKEQRDHRDRS